ncbi:MAG: hypothetical protein MJ137_01815 [Clostridia bacterium]|nr:hypothetical protein [Clostridia bacterium]
MRRKQLTVKLLCIIICLASAALQGCGERFGHDDFYAGETVTPEQLESIAGMIRDEQTEKYPALTGDEGEQLFCWTPGGSVYHRSRACFSLNSSGEVINGTLDEALAAGKTRPCSVCGNAPEPVETGLITP